MTVLGKQEPICATTQSKCGACFTLVSSRAAMQLSVSVSEYMVFTVFEIHVYEGEPLLIKI
jgi:hypothetical protein